MIGRPLNALCAYFKRGAEASGKNFIEIWSEAAQLWCIATVCLVVVTIGAIFDLVLWFLAALSRFAKHRT